MNFTFQQWVAWIGASLAAGVSIVVFAFTTFEPKESVQEFKSTITRYLDRIELRLDRIEHKIDKR